MHSTSGAHTHVQVFLRHTYLFNLVAPVLKALPSTERSKAKWEPLLSLLNTSIIGGMLPMWFKGRGTCVYELHSEYSSDLRGTVRSNYELSAEGFLTVLPPEVGDAAKTRTIDFSRACTVTIVNTAVQFYIDTMRPIWLHKRTQSRSDAMLFRGIRGAPLTVASYNDSLTVSALQ